jgi:hypothetical protein
MIPASSASSGLSPRKGDQFLACSDGHASQLAAKPACCSPLLSHARPSRKNVGVASSPVTGSVTENY